MKEIEQKVVEVLSQLVSPTAARSLLQRALRGQPPHLLGPRAWAELIEGPLQRELVGILPVSGLLPELGRLARELRAQDREASDSGKVARPTLELPDTTEYVDLSREEERQALVQSLARGEGVLAVVLESTYGRALRLGGFGPGLLEMLRAAHGLLERRGGYRVFYTVLGEVQMVLRPLGRGYLALLAQSGANLGQFLFRMRKIEAIRVGAERLGGLE
ncbi:MAG: hypothetical protein NZ849_00550 [Meiothermus sp.]|uniref:hypothetical protein n=1 Tax=Meiothermus sp. TaxID=1955249 RepID=UPI0025F2BE23|nr:hypothetical protein [Meiothermus sp.]MCS7058465.1 hypothetical protein [Meiothermus sp.]MCS7193401.1 hypothetical protein [Meiothermus sp.]MCX7739790.1 hypothetical protein [Meiothermus sp.]MDW8090914.1 hypothetical protein [Meiothermus sp.]MDW8482053.1 hypothetical protein [Meiothermus sp.]